MALLNESVDLKRMDVRVVERNLDRGILSHEEFDKTIRQLPDDADNANWVSLEVLEAESMTQDIDRLNGYHGVETGTIKPIPFDED
jgi:hypothetical protein